ncbi:sigma-70 family RNA polymerase sigma factor [Streptomyces sp. HUCO-GS316]|nr:sigma-70 family RNA polymerase sigma factor [Streptomyces sp. HUCO-GS316]MXM67024.1 sigma-70 family RNA polymerase sigma factor [Streptomyces sp. HUCO-GS316]
MQIEDGKGAPIVSVQSDTRTAPSGPEPAVVARARTGDREAFAVLYGEHHRLVHRYLLLRTRDPHLAEDLVQEVFTRALRGIGGFAWQGREFTAWLITIARNLYLDEMSRSRTRLETLVAEVQDTESPDCGTESLALRELEAVEACETVRRALRTLSPPQRYCVELRYLGGLSPEETAVVMGRTVGAVRALTHRALRRLRWTVRAVPA